MTTQVENQAVIKATVNEKNFFAAMKHLFASSFSVVGELLQNSRRAGATRIDVKSNFVQSELEFIDNGHGIDDFSKLLELSASGWSEETKIKENPFGMGFFSCFGVANRVEVRSKGVLLSATIEDLIEGKHLALAKLPSDDGMTRIKLIGVSENVLGTNAKHFDDQLVDLVMGFDTPVFLNDVELKRPHAKESRQGEDTIIGYVSVQTVHFDTERRMESQNFAALYLQGLPISDDPYYGKSRKNAVKVIHLDGAHFTPQMPDRKHLYDEKTQLNLIDKEIEAVYKRFIIKMKAQLAPEEFLERYAVNAISMGLAHLLNDIPLLPKSFFEECTAVVINTDGEQAFTTLEATASSLNFTLQQFVDCEVNVWVNAPGGADHDSFAVVALKIMQREGIIGLGEKGLDKGHWIFQHATNFNDLTFEVVPIDEQEKSADFGWGDVHVTIKRAQAVTVNMTDAAGQKMTFSIVNDWFLAPQNHDQEDCEHYNCWIIGNDGSNDHPVNAFATFYGEHDAYKEEWEDDAKREWADKVGQLFDEHMTVKLTRALDSQYVAYSEDGEGQFGFVRLIRKSYGDNSYGHLTEDFVAVNPEFMDNLTESLKIQTGNKEIETKQVIRALLAVVRPALYVGGPRNGDHIGQW